MAMNMFMVDGLGQVTMKWGGEARFVL